MESSLRICSRRSSWQCSCAPSSGQKSGRFGRGDCTGANWLRPLCGWHFPHDAGRGSLKYTHAHTRTNGKHTFKLCMPVECCETRLTGSYWQCCNQQQRPNITPGLCLLWEKTQQRFGERPEYFSLLHYNRLLTPKRPIWCSAAEVGNIGNTMKSKTYFTAPLFVPLFWKWLFVRVFLLIKNKFNNLPQHANKWVLTELSCINIEAG